MADVKFSELTSLAAADVDSGDILAVVDTSASTSKKLSIDNLFGAIPVNIAVDDATDTTNGTTGSIQTDGGIGAAKAIYAGTTLTVGTGIVPDGQDGAYLGTSALQFSDLFLADEAVVAFGDDGDVTLTHVHNTGLLLTDASGVGTTQLQFGDTGTYIHQSADGVLDIVSDGTLNATVGAAGMILKGTTPKLTIGDAGAEDTFLVFDGNAQDYRIGIDDGTDILEMGVGAAHGTTPSVKLSSDLSVDIAGHNGTVGLKLGGTVVGSTAAELNLLDGSAKSTASITIADTDALLIIDGNTTKQIPASDLEAYIEANLDTLSSVTSVGTLTGLTVSGAIIPNASGTVDIGSASAEFNDIFLADSSVIKFGADQEVLLTHVADSGLTLSHETTGDNLPIIFTLESSEAAVVVDEVIGQIDFKPTVGSADGAAVCAGISAVAEGTFSDTNNATKLSFKTAASEAAAEKMALSSTGVLTVTGTIAPNASGTIDIGSTALEFNDIFLADASVINFGADQDVTLTHVADAAIMLNTTMAMRWRDATLGINSSVNGQLDVYADAELEITAPIVDIDASTGIALDGANLNSAWLVNTTNQIRFHDTGQYIYAPADARIAIVSDGDIELTATDIKVGLASQDGNIQALTNAYDLTLKQFDGVECARVFDGGKALTDTDAVTRKGGFGHRRPVIDIDASGATKAVTLTDAESGALIKVNASSSYTAAVTLPGVGADSEGVYFDFILEADNGSGVFTVQTAATDSNIFAYGVTVAAIGSDVAGGDVLTIAADATKGTKIRLTAAFGSGTTSAILWIAEYYQPAGTAPAVA